MADKNCKIANLEIKKIKINEKLPFKALQFWMKIPNEIRKIHDEQKFDLVHFNDFSYWFLEKRIIKVKQVVTIHHLGMDIIKNNNNISLISRIINLSGETSIIMPFIEKRCIKYPDKIIAVSNFTKKQILDNSKVKPEKIEVIYNGVYLKEQTFTEEELEESKKEFSIPQKPVILFVGRVDDPRKGLDLLLRSFKIVLEKNDSILLVVGKGDQTEARTLAMSLGILDNVFFTGFVDETGLKKCYALCDVYVVPSRLEGFGLTLLEATVAGKPVVATNVGAIPEIINDMENGILVEPNDIDALASTIIYTLKENLKPDNTTSINIIKKKFDWKNNARQIEDVYKQIIE